MPYTFVGAKTNTANGNSITYTATPGNLLVVLSWTSAGGGSPTASISDNLGSTWNTRTATASIGAGFGAPWYTAFDLPNCGAVTSITVTYNGGTPGTTDILILEYSAIDTAAPYIGTTQAAQSAPGGGATLSSGNLSVASGVPALLIGVSRDDQSNGGFTAGAGYTGRSVTGSAWIYVEDQRATSTGSYAATATETHTATDRYLTTILAYSEYVAPNLDPITACFPIGYYE